MEEEANENVQELPVVDELYIDEEESLDSQDIPEMTPEEADALKEQEEVEIVEEGGM